MPQPGSSTHGQQTFDDEDLPVSTSIFHDDSYAQSCAAVVTQARTGCVELDRTVFYPAGGGQPGDRGALVLENGTRLAVIDTLKGDGDAIVHRVAEESPLPQVGARVTAELD